MCFNNTIHHLVNGVREHILSLFKYNNTSEAPSVCDINLFLPICFQSAADDL